MINVICVSNRSPTATSNNTTINTLANIPVRDNITDIPEKSSDRTERILITENTAQEQNVLDFILTGFGSFAAAVLMMFFGFLFVYCRRRGKS